MRFKLFFILIILNFLFSQSLLNRALGNNETFGSSRSYAMGFTHSLNANNSSLVQYNPSLILYTASNKKLVFDLQTNLSMIKERRSILVKDYFGDFLTYADYVSNSNHYNYFQGGFIVNVNNTIGLAFSLLPIASFDYDYLEEIRGSADIEDGDVGMKDPLVGYQIFNTSGQLNSLSLGSSYSHKNYNIGIGYHKILKTEITDDMHVDSLTTQIENLSEIQDYYHEESFDDLGGYYSVGISFITNEFLLSINFEEEILIKTDQYQGFNFDSSMGVISYLDEANQNFVLSGLNYYKPCKLNVGISYNPKNNSDLTISAEYENNKISDSDEYYYLKNHNIYKLGFEYILSNSTPVRAGLIYKQSPILLMPDQSIITCGTGGNFKNIFYDVGLSYRLFDYYYPDLFPLNNDSNTSFDKITESKLNIVFSMRYLF